MDVEAILAGLNDEQRAAVEAVRGPVCILAGAGTGKTTTITRRIAWQVASGAFAPDGLVAVTFTDKAAGELRSRLGALGVEGVRASTFHSAALALLRRFAGDPGRILASKALLLRQIGNGLPRPFRFRPAADLATEVEWAKNRRLTPQVLELANRLVPRLGGSEKMLRATLDDGPAPELRPNADVVARIRELAAAGVPLEEQAVLVRTNARAADFEEEFHEAGIPFQGASLLARDAARQLLKVLPRAVGAAAGEAVRRVALAQGWLERPADKLGQR